MFSLLAGIVLTQAPTAMSAEEIWQRLEAPISLRTDPTRLATAIDQIASMVGIRIRCDAALQPAVVVIGVRDKPAKEILTHLMDGIGAASFVQNGVLHISMRVATSEHVEKQRDFEIKAIAQSLENRAKQIKLDDPLDLSLAARAAAQIVQLFQTNQYNFGFATQFIQNAANQSPATRSAAKILKSLGPELLRVEGEKPKTLTLKSVSEEKAKNAREALETLEKEQAPWSDTFKTALNLAAKSENAYIAEELLSRCIPIKGNKPDNFNVLITPQPWGNLVNVQIMSGGEILFEVQDYFPRQRTYANISGEVFPVQTAKTVTVPLAERVIRLENYRRMTDNKPKAFDWELMRKVCDPWRNEPISFTRAQPMADVALKLNLNLITYLGDSLVNQLAYPYHQDSPKEVTGDQVLALSSYGATSGLRKKGDWIVGYCTDPEQYLANQIDRPAFGRFLSLAHRPGALTFEQFLRAKKELGTNQLNMARQLARIVRPGFDSLNPVNIEMLEVFGMLAPSQLNQARTSGITLSSLPIAAETKLRQFIGYQRRRAANPLDDSIDALPTVNEIRQAKIFLDQTSQYGIVTVDASPGQSAQMYLPYTYYRFQDFDMFKNYSSMQQVAQTLNNKLMWSGRKDTLMFRFEIKRRRSQQFGTIQYVTDVSQNPLSISQAGDLIQRYFTGQ